LINNDTSRLLGRSLRNGWGFNKRGWREIGATREVAVLEIHQADNLTWLQEQPGEQFDLIYVDPPFNTGKTQERSRLRTVADAKGSRVGYAGKRYRTERLSADAYADQFDDFHAFIGPRLEQLHRLLKADGSLFVHLDYREVHYVKVMLDQIFGRPSFINEIIWAYDYGGRSKSRWSPKHDTILFYAKDPKAYHFDFEAMDRIPYMAPGLVTPEKAARGKTPTDTWWHTIVAPASKERTGYPTQKPLGILERIVKVHSATGDRLLDCFAGSGSFGEAALRNDREVVLVDERQEAVEVMKKRLAPYLSSSSASAEQA
jgi:site-specific DNA-methyltransferase (adenine-specific)